MGLPAFGTWGAMGPCCAKLFHRLLKRAAGWDDGKQRAVCLEELRQNVGLALCKQIWAILEEKAFIQTA